MKNYYSYIIIIALASIGLVSSQHTFANPEGAGPKSETKQITVTLSKEQETRYKAAVKKAGGPGGAEPMLCDFCPKIKGYRLLHCKATSTSRGVKTECSYAK